MDTNESYYNRAINISLRIGFIALLLVYSFEIIKPFIMPVLWGIIIAVALYPFFKRVTKWLKGRAKLASVLITLSLLALLIVPSYFFIESAVVGITDLAGDLEQGGMIFSGIIGLFVGAVVLSITYKVFEAILVNDVFEKKESIKETN